MKRLMLTLALVGGFTALAEEAAPAPAAQPPAAIKRESHARPMRRGFDRRPPMMGMMHGRVRSFGKLADGRETKVFRLQGMGGLILDVSDYGGRLVRCYAPDKFGNLADVTLGWNTAAEYEKYGFSAGTLIGRYGNRIADGKFTLDGRDYQLPINEDKKTEATQRHCNLHGGPEGWDKKVWKVKPLRPGAVQGLELTYVSQDGEMGFPGTVTCKVT